MLTGTMLAKVRVTGGRIDIRPRFYRCGCCEHLHPADYYGDCRDDEARFTDDEVERLYGREGEVGGWLELPQEDCG